MSKIFENNNVIEPTEAIDYDILLIIDWKIKDLKDIRGLRWNDSFAKLASLIAKLKA